MMAEATPPAEFAFRAAAFRAALAGAGVSLALVRQAADLFYYAGVPVDGFLAVAPEADPVLLVRRPQRREPESPWRTIFFKDLRELPAALSRAGLEPRGLVGLELDVMPVAFYNRLQGLFAGQDFQDVSSLIRRQRMVKSPYEIEQLRRAAAVVDQLHCEVPELLRPGLSELEFSGVLEYRLRALGHQGLVRVRTWDLEVFYGHVLSGLSGLEAAYSDTPSGGPGLSPAFPQGPSLKKLAPGEPISIDLAACVNGYIADMTRMYALQSLPERAWEAWETVTQIYAVFESEVRAGVMPGQIYHRIWELVRERGWQDFFMGLEPDRVSFLGHGVGLELDEFPLITAKFPYPLAENMVLAFEPKLFLPAIGMVGLEDTGRVTATGIDWLTHTPRKITII
jgi:Xaa-Pro dipeptidase